MLPSFPCSWWLDRIHQTRCETKTPPDPPTPTRIDYTRLIDNAHHAELAEGVNYAGLAGTAGELSGQFDLLAGHDVTESATDLGTTPGEVAS